MFWKNVFPMSSPQKNTYRDGTDKCLILRVIRLGFEPKTHSLEGCCSIQLSYRTILIVYRFAKIAQILQ